MVKVISTILAVIIVSTICTLVVYYLGNVKLSSAVLIGLSGGIAGFLAPLTVAWIDKQLHKRK